MANSPPEQTTESAILADTIDLSKVKSVALRRLIEEVRAEAPRPTGYNRTYHRYMGDPNRQGGYNRVYHRHNR